MCRALAGIPWLFMCTALACSAEPAAPVPESADVPDVATVDQGAPMPDDGLPDAGAPIVDVEDTTVEDSGTPPIDVPDTSVAPICSAPPTEPPAPTGALPDAAQPLRGIDHWERAAYDKLREAALSDPGVHFVATWDADLGRYVVESGPAEARKRLEYRRVASGSGGVTYEVTLGSVADIFPSTDAGLYGTLEALFAAFTNENDVVLPVLGYPPGDPRVGFLSASAQSYPLPLERIAALFDAPDAPDVVGALYPWALPAPATHGAMSLLQSRSTLILSGRGVRSGVVLDDLAILPDVVPTALAAMGAPTVGGIGPDGTYADGLYLKRQDGRVLWEALTPEPCDGPRHVAILLFDGLAANEIDHEVLDPAPDVELPAFKKLAQGGAVYRYGAVTNFPSVSVPGHMTAGSGLWSGHHGFVANAFFRRSEQADLNPYAFMDDLASVLADPTVVITLYEKAVAPGIETLAQAAHRAFGAWDPAKGTGAFVAVLNEIAIGGADYTTVDFMQGSSVSGLPTADVETYKLADALAVTEVQKILDDPGNPVPTVLQVSFLATDGAGESAGPHSAMLRDTLVTLDQHVATLLGLYAARGALEDTLFILVSDHGMELQDPSRASAFPQKLAASGVKLKQPFPGLIYLRTMSVEAALDSPAGTITVTVLNHDNDAPIEGATVTCDGCAGAGGTTDAAGTVELTFVPGTAELVVTATQGDFNPQVLSVAP